MKKTKILIVVVLVVLLAVFLLIDAKNKNQSIKIGSVEALSGFAAFWGEPSKSGMELAVADLIKEGKNVEVIYEDSEGKPDKAVSAVQKLINIDGVDALFVNFSGPSSAASPVAKENKILYGYSSFDSQIVKDNPYSFKTFFDSTYECKVISEYAKNKLGLSKIAYLGVQLSFTDACVNEMVKVFGKDNVYVEAATKTTETDFRSALSKLKQNGVTFAISYGYEGNYEAIIKQNFETNSNIAIACVESDCYTEKIKSSVPLKSLEGSILYDFKIPEDFRNKVVEKYGEATNVRSAALAYDLTRYMVNAIYACGDDVECQIEHIANDTKTKSVIGDSSYGGDRVFDLKNEYSVVKNGKLEKISLE